MADASTESLAELRAWLDQILGNDPAHRGRMPSIEFVVAKTCHELIDEVAALNLQVAALKSQVAILTERLTSLDHRVRRKCQ